MTPSTRKSVPLFLISLGLGLTGCQPGTTPPISRQPPNPRTPGLSSPRPTPVANPQKPGQAFPNEVVQTFMAGCTGAKVTESACKCTITRLQQTYSYDEFSRINHEMGQGKPAPKSFAEIVAACKQA